MRNRINHYAKLTFIAALFLCGSGSAGAQEEKSEQQFRGSIPIARSAVRLVEIAPDAPVFPGEEVIVSTSGSANVNQHNFEVRRCKYFGLKCWYEKRSNTRILPASSFQVEVALVRADGSTVDSKVITGGKSEVLKYAAEGGLEQGVELHAYISRFTGGPINRQNCGGRPKFCSSGALDLVVRTQNVSRRRAAITAQFENFDGDTVPAQKIRSRRYIDTHLINGPERAKAMQTVLTKYLVEWVDSGAENPQLIDLIAYSLKLSPDPTNLAKLNQARLNALVHLGAYETLEAEAQKLIAELNETCRADCKLSEARQLANSLKSLSIAQAEKRARLRTSDITLSIATLVRGANVLEREMVDIPLGDLLSEIEILSGIYQDAADRLALVRTPAEIEKAVSYMSRSVCLHKLRLDVNKDSDDPFLATTCQSTAS